MKIEGGAKYEVRLVPTNSDREELVFEIVSALNHLGRITNEIFTCIKTRLSEQQSQVSVLTARVTDAATKLSEFKRTTKAIQIISPAKFPETTGTTTITEGPKLFPVLQLKALQEHRKITDSDELMSRIKAKRISHKTVKDTEELLHHYRVHDFNYSKGSSLAELGTTYEVGLGDPPRGIDVVDSFFLFNSSENPYKRYIVSERVGTSAGKGVRKVVVEENDKVKFETGVNESEGDMNEKECTDDFYYFPSSVQIPDIDVPDHLPYLPGLSDTLNFPSPEATSFSAERSIPELLSTQTSPSVPTSLAVSFSKPEQLLPNASPSASAIPPPPPLPPPLFLSKSVTTTSRTSAIQTPAPLVPPVSTFQPPPPPPLPSNEAEVPLETQRPSIPIKDPGPSTDLRSTLMAAIREAGGKSKLKSSRFESQKKKQEEKESSKNENGNDLMADLKNSLAMRRRGISGMNDSRKQPGLGDIMQKIASSIPMEQDLQGGNLSEDDDWD